MTLWSPKRILALRTLSIVYFVVASFVEDGWAVSSFGGGVYTSKAILAIEWSWLALMMVFIFARRQNILIIFLNIFLLLNIPFALYTIFPALANALFGSKQDLMLDDPGPPEVIYFVYNTDTIVFLILCIATYFYGLVVALQNRGESGRGVP